MDRSVRRSDSEQAQEIWKQVSRAAEGTPEWVRERVSEAARSSASRIKQSSSSEKE